MALQILFTFLVIYTYWIITAIQDYCLKPKHKGGDIITHIVRIGVLVSAIFVIWGF